MAGALEISGSPLIIVPINRVISVVLETSAAALPAG